MEVRDSLRWWSAELPQVARSRKKTKEDASRKKTKVRRSRKKTKAPREVAADLGAVASYSFLRTGAKGRPSTRSGNSSSAGSS